VTSACGNSSTTSTATGVGVVENLWDKYRGTLRDIEGEWDAAKVRLDGFLKELGYGADRIFD